MKLRPMVTQLLRKVGLYHAVAYARYTLFAKQHGMTLKNSGGAITVDNGNRRIIVSAKHPAYVHTMIQYFNHYHSAVRPIIVDGVSVVDYSSPRLHCLSRSGLEFIFPSLAETDEAIEAYITALKLKPGDAVLDLGAYAGATAYYLSKAVGPDGRVLALEPDEINFRYLQENVTRHALKNVTCVPFGIWNEETTVEFQSEGSSGSAVATIIGRSSNVRKVSMITLERAADVLRVDRIAGIKMDIEGAEMVVLKSARNFLTHHQPRIIIEPHFIDGVLVTDELCRLMHSYGFKTELLSQDSEYWPLVAAYPET
jgi:FkbM family methyltransferase